MKSAGSIQRVAIEGVSPEVEAGRFPAKRTLGEPVSVEADVFADGHDCVCAVVAYRKHGSPRWKELPMAPLVNDRWRGEFPVDQLGLYEFTIKAWTDAFASWQRDLKKRIDAEQDVTVELQVGAGLLEAGARRARAENRRKLQAWTKILSGEEEADPAERVWLALNEELTRLMAAHPDRRHETVYARKVLVEVDRPRAAFSSWYELFPRSYAQEPGEHGTFKDLESHLPYIASMGFDVLYLPPIHPIGRTFRKGPNNSLVAGPKDPGSPWAIGSAAGGHKSIHPELGTIEDFRNFLTRAGELGIELALDVALQCSPDHPYVTEHPEWFRQRPDGTIQYAENPPKKYQDIYPFDFESKAAGALWNEILSIFEFWIEQGIRIFRVDNPHTKPFPFWEWLIRTIKKSHPETIFLAEAFTRPKVMYQLAKAGFTQSYTYFAWRSEKWELRQYMEELTRTAVTDFFRPNLWPNTPDILTEQLQTGGRPVFISRLILAGTLAANYGVYGAAFELCESRPREPGSEEYLDSEKYQIRRWELNRPDSLRDYVTRVNRIRRENPALQSDSSLRFHEVQNDRLICYSKHTAGGENAIVVVVNLDPHQTHSGWVQLPLVELGIDPERPYQMHDLLSDARYLWRGEWNYVELNPAVCPAHIFRVRRHVRTEHDFDYYA